MSCELSRLVTVLLTCHLATISTNFASNPSALPGPIFLSETGTVVKARPLGRVALHCVVESQGPFTVSWMRQADLQILSVGSLLVSSDPRLAISYSRRRHDHQLTIGQVGTRDEGGYECQLNTSPPRSLVVEVDVVNVEVLVVVLVVDVVVVVVVVGYLITAVLPVTVPMQSPPPTSRSPVT